MNINRLSVAIALGILVLAVAAGLREAEGAGILEADATKRAMQVLIGLVLAAYANVMPKQLGRARRSPEAEARAQSALRVSGWCLTLAGLAYAGLWAFAPLPVADIASVIAVAAALAIAVAYVFWSVWACRGARDRSVG